MKNRVEIQSPLVNSGPWYDRLYRSGGHPNHAVLPIHFRGLHLMENVCFESLFGGVTREGNKQERIFLDLKP